MPSTSSSGPASGKSDEEYAQILAQEMAALRDREERTDTSPSTNRPAGGGYSRYSSGSSSATDAMIVKNIRAAMSDKRPRQ